MMTGTFTPAVAASRGRMMSATTRSGVPLPSLSRVVSTYTVSRMAVA